MKKTNQASFSESTAYDDETLVTSRTGREDTETEIEAPELDWTERYLAADR